MALIDKLTAIADAIRGKTGKTDPLTLEQMATEISGIEAGGGGTDYLAARIDQSLTEYSSGDVETIAAYALYGCSKLTRAHLPNATSVGTSAFYGCGKLSDCDFSSVETIGEAAFRGNSRLMVASFPSAKTVDKSAFYSSGVTELNFPICESFGYECFRACNNFTSISFPAALVVGERVFYQCNGLITADFKVASSIGTYAFRSCTNLSTLILRKSDAICALSAVNALDSTPFASGGTGGTVYVPSALIESYQTATNWSTLYTAGTCNFVAIEGSEHE